MAIFWKWLPLATFCLLHSHGFNTSLSLAFYRFSGVKGKQFHLISKCVYATRNNRHVVSKWNADDFLTSINYLTFSTSSRDFHMYSHSRFYRRKSPEISHSNNVPIFLSVGMCELRLCLYLYWFCVGVSVFVCVSE